MNTKKYGEHTTGIPLDVFQYINETLNYYYALAQSV